MYRYVVTYIDYRSALDILNKSRACKELYRQTIFERRSKNLRKTKVDDVYVSSMCMTLSSFQILATFIQNSMLIFSDFVFHLLYVQNPMGTRGWTSMTMWTQMKTVDAPSAKVSVICHDMSSQMHQFRWSMKFQNIQIPSTKSQIIGPCFSQNITYIFNITFVYLLTMY